MATTLVQTPGPSLTPTFSPAHTMTHVPVLLRTMAPFDRSLSLYLPLSATPSDVLDAFLARASASASTRSLLRLHTLSGRLLSPSSRLGDLRPGGSECGFLELEVRASFLGGKGGFGSMLRAQGGKMSRRKGEEENTDSCRDLNGRRLSTVKEAKA